jgi:hypothetical protein
LTTGPPLPTIIGIEKGVATSMTDIVDLFLGVAWWFRLLRCNPVRALVIVAAAVIALVVLIVGIRRITDPRLHVLLIVVIVLALTAVALWASLTAPKQSREVPTGPDEWKPPPAEEVDRILGGSRRSRAND